MQSERNCLSTEELAEFSASNLTGEARVRASEHLDRCPRCRKRLADLSGSGSDTVSPATSAGVDEAVF